MRNCYKKHYLKKVIIRIDFASEIEELKKNISPQIVKRILPSFPIDEPKKTMTTELRISPKHKVTEFQTEGKQWFYHSKNREKTLCISSSFFFVEYNLYKSYDELKVDFLAILKILPEEFPNISIKRFGIRYINHIEIDEIDIFEWGKYIESKFLSGLSLPKDNRKILRVFNNFTTSDEDMILQVQYGMYNPDFPASIKRKLFILDLDAYYQGLIEPLYIENKIDKFHDSIEDIFELAITDELREKMGVVRHG